MMADCVTHADLQAALKLLSLKLLCVLGTTHVLSAADRSRRRALSSAKYVGA